MTSAKVHDLARELSALSPELRARLAHHGFDEARFLTLAASLQAPAAAGTRNRLKGEVRPPEAGEVLDFPQGALAEECRALGDAALTNGEAAMVVLAGGMATRMGGVVKALVEALPGKTFLQLRLAENRALGRRYGKPVPLWLMTSDATDEPTKHALQALGAEPHVRTFVQDLALRLTPEGALFRDDDGEPSTYAPGHGDLPDALRRSGFLREFRSGGGKVVAIANLDNLGATIDPLVLGVFLREQTRRGVMALVEVCDKAGDKGGIPVHAEGTLQVVEEFRLPPDFDPTSVPFFNTNNFVVDARALDETPIPWSWFLVEKTTANRKAIQFERLIQELTKVLPAAYLRVPRTGAESRFLPVKDHDELARRRPDLEAVAKSRGMAT